MASELRLSEHYVSTQGEGPRVGELTQFVRFAGCNMRCPGWPCDTQHAIQPELYLNDSTRPEPLELLDAVANYPGKNICLTGGEPFLQPAIKLQEFVEGCSAEGYSLECFTNGSFSFPMWALQHMSFMMDWKLNSSGEGTTGLVVRTDNAKRLRRHDGIKFVVKSLEDLKEAQLVWNYLIDDCDVQAQFWVGAVWGAIEPGEIVEFLIETQVPWKLNVQVHKYIWHPDERGV